jgi:hypothetical protein
MSLELNLYIVENGTSCVRLLNPTNKNVQIRPEKVVASAYSISESDIFLILTNPLQTHCDSVLEMQEIFPFD